MSTAAPDPTNNPEPTSTANTSASTTSTNALETNAMSDNEIRRNDESPEFTDPTADPATPTGASGLSSHLGWPDTPTSTSGTATSLPDPTTPIPTTATRAVPASTPFRVEPATPVPDDVVREPDQAPSSQLPHLPPPVGAPVHAAPTPRTARPALVYVRRGPRPGAIMLGLLSMIVAGYVLAANLTDADLSLRLVGPPMIGAFGGMLLIVGLVGVVVGRLRR